MRIPHLVVMSRHSVAALTVSYGRIWHTRDTGELILGYNVCGRLARVVFVDPRSALPVSPTPGDAVTAALRILCDDGTATTRDIEVLESALKRAAGSNGADTRHAPQRAV